jgi:hypothetical protein
MQCPKCRSNKLTQRWHSWDSYEPRHYGFGGEDHMHYWCDNCKYDWVIPDKGSEDE